MAFVLAGGRGSRLLELTDRRAKPAVYFGGKMRIIDFALSNALNSGIRRIGVATQYQGAQPDRASARGAGISFVPAATRASTSCRRASACPRDQWYAGTADAVFQNIDIIRDRAPKYMVILAGDHIYKMDYEVMLQQHVDSGADVTIGCLEVPRKEASGFGVMHVDANNGIVDFVEKPKHPPPMPGHPDKALASMGIYVFETNLLFDQLERDASGSEVEPRFRQGHHSLHRQARQGDRASFFAIPACVRLDDEAAYWRDVGTSTPIGRPISI